MRAHSRNAEVVPSRLRYALGVVVVACASGLGAASCGEADGLLLRFRSARVIPAEANWLKVTVSSSPEGVEINRRTYPLEPPMSFPLTLGLTRGSMTPAAVRIEASLTVGTAATPVATGIADVEFRAGETQTIDIDLVEESASTGGLLAHWKLDETGGVTAMDSSGNNTGMLVGRPTWGMGKLGGGLRLNGADDFVQVPGGPGVDPGASVSLVAWVHPTAYTTASHYAGIVFKLGKQYGCCFQPAYALGLTPGGAVIFAVAGPTSSASLSSKETVPLNGWTHVAAVRAGGFMRIYIDCKPVASATSGMGILDQIAERPVYLGRSDGAWGTDRFRFTGSLDDVRIYKRGLSEPEIRELYGAAGTPCR